MASSQQTRNKLQRILSILDVPQAYRALGDRNSIDLFTGQDCGSIHPIFRREAIVTEIMPPEAILTAWGEPIDEITYNNARPALALATTLLKQGQWFYWTILTGECPKTIDGKSILIPNPYQTLATEEKEQFEIELQTLSELTMICNNDPDLDHESGISTYGSTRAYIAGWKADQPEEEIDVVYRISCCIPLWRQLSDPKFDQRPLLERCTIWVILAATLCHEIAHLVWMHRWNGDIFDDFWLNNIIDLPDEPIFLPFYDQAELGNAWEHYQFGGTVWQAKQVEDVDGVTHFNPVYDGRSGVEIVPWGGWDNQGLIENISSDTSHDDDDACAKDEFNSEEEDCEGDTDPESQDSPPEEQSPVFQVPKFDAIDGYEFDNPIVSEDLITFGIHEDLNEHQGKVTRIDFFSDENLALFDAQFPPLQGDMMDLCMSDDDISSDNDVEMGGMDET